MAIQTFQVLGPPRAALLNGEALDAYTLGATVAASVIERHGLAWSAIVDQSHDLGVQTLPLSVAGWYSQGWDDHYAAELNAVVESAA